MEAVILSAIFQLATPAAPAASTLCAQELVRQSDGKHILKESTQFLNPPQYAANVGAAVGASTIEPHRTLTPQQVAIVKELHAIKVCATRKIMP
jgi:hypothetical protein